MTTNTDAEKAEYLPLDEDDAAAHMYPSDLEKFKRGEHFADACSVKIGNETEESVGLYTVEQVHEAIDADRAQRAAPVAPPDKSQDPDLWEVIGELREAGHDAWADRLELTAQAFTEDVYDQCCEAIKPLVDAGRLPGSVVDSMRILVAAHAPVAPPPVGDGVAGLPLDPMDAVRACYAQTRQAQGTIGSRCFLAGVEWAQEKLKAATPVAQAAGPFPFDVQAVDSTVFASNERGTNMWSAQVQPGHDDDGNRLSKRECATIARDLAALAGAAPQAQPFQQRVQPWLMACFGEVIAADREERNHRFLEEAIELVQACGCTASEAHQLVDYVFGRPVGEKQQEVGGVAVTLAALCLAHGLDMHEAGEVELRRIWTMVDKIRAKQAAKPKHSPLPAAAPQPQGDTSHQVHGWQPIETAPKQGAFLVYMPNEMVKVQAARINATGLWVIGNLMAFDMTKPTHWTPLPAAPAGIGAQPHAGEADHG